MVGLLLYGVVLAAVLLSAPAQLWDPVAVHFFVVIGAIGMWRYSWGALHLVRAQVYRRLVFPRWRKAAARLGEDGRASHVYLLVTSFRIDAETTRNVYAAAIREAIDYGVPATIVASIVEMADQRLIKTLFERFNPPAHVTLTFVRIVGSGKRDAIACGLRAISISRPRPDAVVCLIDGDSIIGRGTLANTMPFFKLFPHAAALTTDEVCVVKGKRIFREWYNLRFAQRQVLMCSLALSRRVLTLTGRMSAFRADIVCEPEFIAGIELDYIDHWRLGRFKFLTGDDKSSWFWVLKNGYEMLYIPDVRVRTVEHPPADEFLKAAQMLMIRWFGNMLRTNTRAILLGPRPMGLFTWWCIVDQRLSMWTSLVGPVATLMLAVFVNPLALPLYLLWVAFTRYVQTLLLLSVRREVSAFYPFLLYFNQVFGSIIKIYILFRLDRQRWTRQNTTNDRALAPWRARVNILSSRYVHAASVLLFVVAVGSAAGAVPIPDAQLFLSFF